MFPQAKVDSILSAWLPKTWLSYASSLSLWGSVRAVNKKHWGYCFLCCCRFIRPLRSSVLGWARTQADGDVYGTYPWLPHESRIQIEDRETCDVLSCFKTGGQRRIDPLISGQCDEQPPSVVFNTAQTVFVIHILLAVINLNRNKQRFNEDGLRIASSHYQQALYTKKKLIIWQLKLTLQHNTSLKEWISETASSVCAGHTCLSPRWNPTMRSKKGEATHKGFSVCDENVPGKTAAQ